MLNCAGVAGSPATGPVTMRKGQSANIRLPKEPALSLVSSAPGTVKLTGLVVHAQTVGQAVISINGWTGCDPAAKTCSLVTIDVVT